LGFLFNLFSNDLPVTRGQKFIYADDISLANTSANWNAVSHQTWRGCHTSVDSGDLSQVLPKQSAVCSTYIIPAPPVNCQFICMASAFGMSVTQCHPTYLGVTLDCTLSYREHLTKIAGKLNKNLAIANRSRVSYAHNTSRASIGRNITL